MLPIPTVLIGANSAIAGCLPDPSTSEIFHSLHSAPQTEALSWLNFAVARGPSGPLTLEVHHFPKRFSRISFSILMAGLGSAIARWPSNPLTLKSFPFPLELLTFCFPSSGPLQASVLRVRAGRLAR